MLHDGVSGTIFLQVVMKGEVAGTEVHGRGDAELEASVESEFTQYAYGESHIPTVLIYRNMRRLLDTVGIDILGDSGILELDILGMGSDEYAKMERAQVGIRAILYRPKLRHTADTTIEGNESRQYDSLHICYLFFVTINKRQGGLLIVLIYFDKV